MGLINWRDDESMDDLVKRAQKLLKQKEVSGDEGKALVVRCGEPPTRDPGGGKVPRLPIGFLPPAAPSGGIHPLPMPSQRHVDLYTPPRQNVIAPWAGTVTPLQSLEWIHLPRYCVQYDELYLAQYGWRNGESEYLSSVEFPKHLQSRYSVANAFAIPLGFRAQREQCAICLTWTPSWAIGAVWCSDGCGWRVCYGRTSQDRFFVCRDSCGNRGLLIPSPGDKTCLVPGGRGGHSTR